MRLQEEVKANAAGFAKKFNVHFDSLQSCDQPEENITSV